MRVLLAGATGVLGRRLVRSLADAGHEAIGLTRDERGDGIVRDLGGTPIRADLFQADEIIAQIDSTDAVIHAATAIPTKQRPSKKDWGINDRIRIEGIESMIEVARRTGAKQLIFQSVVWVARPDDESPFDENDPANPDDVTESAATAERMTMTAGLEYGFVPTVLRGGWFYGPDAWHTKSFGQGLKKRMMPIVGDGTAQWSILHADDAASAYISALEKRPEGIFHVVDDEPVQVGHFLQHFAECLGAKPPIHVPVWLAKLAAGSYAADFTTTSMITSADRFKTATDWAPRYASYREGLNQVVSIWESEGAT